MYVIHYTIIGWQIITRTLNLVLWTTFFALREINFSQFLSFFQMLWQLSILIYCPFPVKGGQRGDLYDGFIWQPDPSHTQKQVFIKSQENNAQVQDVCMQDCPVVLHSSQIYSVNPTSMPLDCISNRQSVSVTLSSQKSLEIIRWSHRKFLLKERVDDLLRSPISPLVCHHSFPALILNKILKWTFHLAIPPVQLVEGCECLQTFHFPNASLNLSFTQNCKLH